MATAEAVPIFVARLKGSIGSGAIPEYAIADRFLEEYSDRVMYHQGGWYTWEGRYWKLSTDFDIKGKLDSMLRQANHAANLKFGVKERNKAYDVLRCDKSFVYPATPADSDFLNSKQHQYLPFENGVLDIEANEMLPHNPKYRFTGVYPVHYNEEAECPMWERFLERTFYNPSTGNVDEQQIQLLQQAFGYTIQGALNMRQVGFVLLGEGATGKSTIMAVVQMLLGEFSIFTASLREDIKEEERFAAKYLVGRRAILADESDDKNGSMNDALLKKIMDGMTPISARDLYQSRTFTVRVLAKLWWAMNKFPRTHDKSDGLWRRLIIFYLLNPMREAESRDIHILNALRSELSGILNWALEGMHSLHKGGFVESTTSVNKRDELRMGNDVVAQFVDEWLVIDSKEDGEILCGRMYQEFMEWTKVALGVTSAGQRVGRNKFLEQLEAIFLKMGAYRGRSKSSGARAFRNVRLKSDEEKRIHTGFVRVGTRNDF